MLLVATMIKFDAKLIGYVTTFENLTKAKVKDAFFEKGYLVFIVEEGDAGKAIGRKGNNIRMISRLLKKKIKLIEFNSDVKEFVKNIIDPLKADEIVEEDNKIKIRSKDLQTKSFLIGRNRTNITNLNNTVKKYFNVEVSVV